MWFSSSVTRSETRGSHFTKKKILKNGTGFSFCKEVQIKKLGRNKFYGRFRFSVRNRFLETKVNDGRLKFLLRFYSDGRAVREAWVHPFIGILFEIDNCTLYLSAQLRLSLSLLMTGLIQFFYAEVSYTASFNSALMMTGLIQFLYAGVFMRLKLL